MTSIRLAAPVARGERAGSAAGGGKGGGLESTAVVSGLALRGSRIDTSRDTISLVDRYKPPPPSRLFSGARVTYPKP